MKCSGCHCDETKVLESRLSGDGRSIRRRRICRQCDYRFTTYEKEDQLVLHIKKRDGHIELYQREKALHSIQIACRKREVRIEEIEFIVGKVESRIFESGDRVISSQQLGKYILEFLLELDSISYIRFASVYEDFKDPSEFSAMLKSMASRPKMISEEGPYDHEKRPCH